MGVDAVVRELVDPVMVRDAARVGGESVVRDAVDDVRSGGSGSSSSSIQGVYISGGKFILCSSVFLSISFIIIVLPYCMCGCLYCCSSWL